jgi:hypothetical protein
MKKILLAILFCLFPVCLWAGYQHNSILGGRDYCISVRSQDGSVANEQCRPLVISEGALTESGSGPNRFYILRAGLASGGATTAVTTDTVISTSHSKVDKEIASDPAFSQGMIPDGTPGQLLTILVTVVQAGGTFTLIPDTAHGFTYLVFEAVGDMVTLLYVDDNVGWIIVSQGSVQSGN